VIELGRFLYRQKQKAIYYLTGNATRRMIAEINQLEEKITFRAEGYLIRELGLLVPKEGFDFIFQPNTFNLLLEVFRSLGGKYRFIEDQLLFEFSDLRIEITSKSELFILNEIFVNKCYQFFLPDREEVRLVDIGMNVGLAALFFAGLPYVQKVYAFEPFEPTFHQGLRNLERNPMRSGKVEVFNFGLGDEEKEITVDYNPFNKGINPSITSGRRNGFTRKEKISIKSASAVLNDLMRQYPGGNFIIKIDTEGSEYQILESLSKGNLSSQVKGMIIEWHFRGPENLERMLLAAGFTLASVRLTINSGLIYAFR
jgi:FkbM family methyltransferase